VKDNSTKERGGGTDKPVRMLETAEQFSGLPERRQEEWMQ